MSVLGITEAVARCTEIDHLGGMVESDRSTMPPEMRKEMMLFQRAMNAAAMDLYQQLCAVRNIENRNFIFFTSNLIGSLSMLYAGAPEDLQAIIERDLHMGPLKGQKWHHHFQHWSEEIQSRSRTLSQSVPSMLKAADFMRFTFQQIQVITHHSETPLVDRAKKNLAHYRPEIFSFTEPEEARQRINEQVAQSHSRKDSKPR